MMFMEIAIFLLAVALGFVLGTTFGILWATFADVTHRKFLSWIHKKIGSKDEID